MARIQWTPIVAPDITETAVRAQQASGAAIQQALGGFTGLLNDWEGSQREKNLTELFTRQNAFAGTNDVTGYQADLADGDLVRGLSYLKSGDLAAARGFTGDLRTGRAAETAYSRGQVIAGREDKSYARGEADLASGVIVARGVAAIKAAVQNRTITPEEGTAREAALMQQTQNAGQIASASGAVESGVNALRDDTRWDRGTVEYNDGRQNRAWAVEDRTNEQTAQALALTFQEFGPNVTNEDLMASDAYKAAPVGARVRALALLGLEAPAADLAAVSAATGSFAGGGTISAPDGGWPGGAPDGSRVMNYEARGVGVNMVPDTVRTLGDASTFARGVNRRGAGSSAMGLYQITGDTLRDFGPRVFGRDWQNIAYGPEAEDKIGEAIFNASRGSAAALSGRWTSLTRAEAEQVRRMPWAEARRVIAQGESGARISPQQAQGQATDIAVGATVAASTDRYGRLARTIVPAMNDDTPTLSVVRSLAESDVFRGTDEGRIGRLIREVQQRYDRQSDGGSLSASAAGQILLASAKPFDAGKDFISNLFGASSGVGQTGGLFSTGTNTVSWTDIDGMLGQLRPNAQGQIPLAANVRTQENNAAMIANAPAGRAALANTRAALQAQEERDRRLGQSNNPATARLRQQYQQLETQWGSFVGDSEAQLQDAFGVPNTPPPRQPVARGPATAPVPIRRRAAVSPLYGSD